LSHSHLSLQHLIRKAEELGARKEKRDNRPGWIVDFVDQLADLFEPIHDVGRVGYDCEWTEAGWVVGLYLGSTEIIGGPSDGQITPPSFHFDVQQLLRCFIEIESLQLHALHSTDLNATPVDNSYIEIDGIVGQNERILLQVHVTPPDAVGPGFHQYADGSLVTA